MCSCFCRMLLPAMLLALPTGVYALETNINYGAHDFVVSNISPSSLHGGGTSHTIGINAGVSAKHDTTSGVTLGGSADFYLEHNKDHLDPDHVPIWFRLHLFANGNISKVTENTDLKWHVDLGNKQNTASGVEREIKQFYGLGLDYNRENYHLAFNSYGGFFYLEIDDDAPREYAGYDREDLDDGTSAMSLKLEGNVKLSEDFFLSSHFQNWSSLGVGSDWLENEFFADISYNSNDWIKGSRLHFSATYTKYNLSGFYRSDLGKPVLPWDNDTLLHVYISVPWKI